MPNHGRLRSSVFFVLDGVFDNWDGVFGIWDNVFGLFWQSSENLSTALKLFKSTLFVALVTNMSYGLKWSIFNLQWQFISSFRAGRQLPHDIYVVNKC